MSSLNSYVTDLQNMGNAFYQALAIDPSNRTLYEWGVFNFTNSLGMFSPILRRCYEIGGEVDNNWIYFWNQTSSVQLFYNMIKANIVQNYTNIDDRSSSLYDAVLAIDLPQVSFDFFRLTYLFLLQTLTSPQNVVLSSPN